MDDFNIMKILPDLSSEKHEAVIEVLHGIGAKSNANLHLVTENDLSAALPLLEARQLVEAWRPSAPASSETNGADNSESNCDPSIESKVDYSEAGWQYKFNIPWHSFPEPLLKCCEEGKPPEDRDRREMIRILATGIMKVARRPARKSVDPIAHAIVSKYPSSFMDKAYGCNLGSGHSSITNQILFRIDNFMKSERARKRSANTTFIESPASPRNNATGNEYGCISWSPPLEEELLDEYEENRLYVLAESKKVFRDHQEIARSMALTYPLQRKTINSNASIELIKSKWPLLFEETYLFQHYFTLTGKHQEQFIQNMEEKCCQIYKALEKSTLPRVVKKIACINALCDAFGTETPKSKCFIELLCTYFREKECHFFTLSMIRVSVTYAFVRFQEESEELIQKLPSHPFIIVIGQSVAGATGYVVTIEQTVVYRTKSLYAAVSYMFACYYVFNMEYPKDLVATLEFMQRFFARIAAEGTKSTKKRKSDIHPKVLKLAAVLRYED